MALDRKPVDAFSDFLLHDIGTGDGIDQGAANGNELRSGDFAIAACCSTIALRSRPPGKG